MSDKNKKNKKPTRGKNPYDSWTGAAETTGREIYTTTKPYKKLKLSDPQYAAIGAYLPPVSARANKHVFVGRVATISKKVAGKAVVKLFVNHASWDSKVVPQLEAMEFTQQGRNRDQLISDVNIKIQAGQWKANCPVEIFRNLPGAPKPMAKIRFTKNSRHVGPQSGGVTALDAFWCW
jgi:hypothetical protein